MQLDWYLEGFLTPVDFLTAIWFLPLWFGSLQIARLLMELDVAESEGPPPVDKDSAAYYLWLTRPSSLQDRQQKLATLGQIFLYGGFALLLMSAVARATAPGLGELMVPVLLYFALGVTLLSQARFSVVRASWRFQRVTSCGHGLHSPMREKASRRLRNSQRSHDSSASPHPNDSRCKIRRERKPDIRQRLRTKR